MAISFNRVPEIKSGDEIKSKHMTDLGVAINQRLRSGLGDPTWRLVWYADSLARQFRNRDASGFVWPSKSEWLEVYATVHPAEATFPIQDADTAEGCNLASPLNQFVFGDSDVQPNNPRILPEDERLLSVPMWSGDHPATTPTERWGIGKLQRGGWDPVTNAIASPVFDTARQHYRMTRPLTNQHGNSYGGFAPTPELILDPICSDGTLDFPPSPNYEIKFTHIPADPQKDVVFPGTCPQTEGHVAGIRAIYPFEYQVFIWDSTGPDAVAVLYTAKKLLFSEYIEGPYSGGNTLTKQQGEHLQRVLNYFSAQYRGTSEQRAVVGTWNDHAFDTQKFFESQYLLAPAKGTDTGGGAVSSVYPLFSKVGVGAITAGTKLPKLTPPAGPTHTVAEKCVIASLFVETHDLAGDCTIEVLANGVSVNKVTVTPNQPTDILVLTKPIAKGVVVEIRVVNDVGFTRVQPNTGVTVELAELMDYKPWPHDHFLVLRLGGCRIDLFNGTDGYGDDEQASAILATDYFRWGMISNLRGNASNPGSFDIVNSNAVHEAARQLFRCVRILRPEQLVAYEVAGGKSILTFDRWTEGKGSTNAPQGGNNPPPETETPSGEIVQDAKYTVRASGSDSITYDGTTYTNLEGFRGVAGVATYTKTGTTGKVYLVTQFLPDSDIGGISGDCLAGIAPDPDPIPTGQIRWKRNYKVWATAGGTITYNGKDYTNGQPFQGAENRASFTATGDAAVYEADGIRHTAEPENFTNEWLMGFQFKAYNNKEESIWKPDAYSRYFSFSERCHFYPDPLSLSTSNALDAQAMRHFAYGDRIWLAPEAPPGYRYGLGLNAITSIEDQDRKRNFYKSCRLYEPDLEIDKVELVDQNSGLVRVTMKGRFHSDPTAAASFGPDPNTWNLSALRAEPYRTTDNALREFLYYKSTGTNASLKVGDAAENSQVNFQFDKPYGTVWPHIFFTKLVPTPYVDNNDSQDYWDTPFLHDQLLLVELYLRVICEGYIDGKTTSAYGCDTGIQAMFDYTFTNLCFDAFQGRWIRTLPSLGTKYIEAEHTRPGPDIPMGFGPLPNTIAAAETFNLFAKCVNKLTSVRVMLPSKFQQQRLRGIAYLSVRATDPDGSIRDCTARPGLPGIIFEGVGPDPSVIAEAWEDAGDFPGVSSGFGWGFASFDGNITYACDGNLWVILSERIDHNFKWTLLDPDAALAIPESWRTQIDVDGTYLGHMTKTRPIQTKEKVAYESSADCLGSLGWWPTGDGKYLDFKTDNVVIQDECGLFGNSGTISAPGLPSEVIAGGYNLGMCPVQVSGSATFTPIPNDGFALTIPLV